MRRVYVESPYAGNVKRNVRYARACVKHCLTLGEAPFASHLFYTQVLDDTKENERSKGIDAGLAWGQAAEATVVYVDMGLSRGMKLGIDAAIGAGRPIDVRGLHNTDESKKTAIEVLRHIQETAQRLGKAVAVKP